MNSVEPGFGGSVPKNAPGAGTLSPALRATGPEQRRGAHPVPAYFSRPGGSGDEAGDLCRTVPWHSQVLGGPPPNPRHLSHGANSMREIPADHVPGGGCTALGGVLGGVAPRRRTLAGLCHAIGEKRKMPGGAGGQRPPQGESLHLKVRLNRMSTKKAHPVLAYFLVTPPISS